MRRDPRFHRIVVLAAAMSLSIAPAIAQSVQSPVPSSVVAAYDLDPSWYAKYGDAGGLPILGSSNLDDATLVRARAQTQTLLQTYPYRAEPALKASKVRVVLVARNERMSSIPEVYAAFGTSLDDRYWGGMGATLSLPLSVGTEANLMDNYGDENVFVHELGHTVMEMALVEIDPKFSNQLDHAYGVAMAKGLWRNTYAGVNRQEYWAEGVQAYFNANREGPVGGDGVHNNINTRVELQRYDRLLFDLLDRVYRGATLP